MPYQASRTNTGEASHVSTNCPMPTTLQGSASEKAVETIQKILASYVGQLTDGCGDPECREVACATGHRNTSTRPVRPFKPRSARAIALALANGPRPRQHLCPRYLRRSTLEKENNLTKDGKPLEGPRDSLSLVQQLSDTSTIRQICQRHGGERDVPGLNNRRSSPDNTRLEATVAHLNNCLTALDMRDGTLCEDEITHVLYTGLRSLLRCLMPKVNQNRTIDLCNAFVSYGFATASRSLHPNEQKAVTKMFEVINNVPARSLLQRLAQYLSPESAAPHQTHDAEGHHMPEVPDTRPLHLLCIKLADGALVSDVAHLEVKCLCIWLKQIFHTQWEGGCFLSQSQGYVARWLNFISHKLGQHWSALAINWPTRLPVLSGHLEATRLAQTWMISSRPQRRKHLFFYKCLFSDAELATYFRTINHSEMQKAHSKAVKATNLRSRADSSIRELRPSGRLAFSEEHYLLICVSRGHILEDTFDQIWQRRKSELRRPLRVRLGEVDEYELGHDLGGVQIEFFNLLCKELFRPDSPFFETNLETGLSYFRPGSLQPLYMFELIGMIFALAIYNGITLPVNFSKTFYHQFWAKFDDPKDLQDYWPAIGRSLDTILQQDVQGVDAAFSLEANGLRLSIMPGDTMCQHDSGKYVMKILDAVPIATATEASSHTTSNQVPEGEQTTQLAGKELIDQIADGWPGWHLEWCSDHVEEITADNKVDFVNSYIGWLMYESVRPQLTAFQNGFAACLGPESPWMAFFDHGSLRKFVEGSRHLDLADLISATRYDGYHPSSPYIRSFWAIVGSWTVEKQWQLIKFVTAAERMPAGGASQLNFKIVRTYLPSLDRLPTSSTCFGTLMLPRYARAAILEEKLSLAIEFGMEGFGAG